MEQKRYEWQVFCPVCKASNCNNNITCIKCDAPLEPTNKPEAPMTWEQCLQTATNKDGRYPDFQSWQNAVQMGYAKAIAFRDIMMEAAHLFAESRERAAFHRGAREQREICAEHAQLDYSYLDGEASIDHNSILNAPAPQFKP